MDDEAVGRVIRTVRQRKGWRQRDLAGRADVSQQEVSLIERGRFDLVSLATSRRVADKVDIKLQLAPRWRGGDVFRLLDAEHARLVERVVRELRTRGFELLVEYSFNHYGERGSVDVIGWHAGWCALLVVEVKSRIVDVQDLLGTLDRKVRIVPDLLARERGWRAQAVGRVVVLPGTKRVRTAVAAHAATFDVAFPSRGHAIRRWLGDPVGPLSGIWFLADTKDLGARQAPGTRVRVNALGQSRGVAPPRPGPVRSGRPVRAVHDRARPASG